MSTAHQTSQSQRLPLAGTANACQVRAIGLTVGALVTALHEAERQKCAHAKSGTDEAISAEMKWERCETALEQQIRAQKDLALTIRAESAAGALHQLMIAGAYVDELWEMVPDRSDDRAAYLRGKHAYEMINWAIHSIAAVLAAASEDTPDDLGAGFYMAFGSDPHSAASAGLEAA
jgi:hypothetical protein